MSTTIDPIEYGAMLQKVDSMDKKIDKMERQIDELIMLANKSRGGIWVGMAIISFVSGLVGFFLNIKKFHVE